MGRATLGGGQIRSECTRNQPTIRGNQPSRARLYPEATYDEYVMRGESENRNKELEVWAGNRSAERPPFHGQSLSDVFACRRDESVGAATPGNCQSADPGTIGNPRRGPGRTVAEKVPERASPSGSAGRRPTAYTAFAPYPGCSHRRCQHSPNPHTVEPQLAQSELLRAR